MKLKLVVNESTTNSELIHLGNFFTALGLNRGAYVVSAPADPAELDEPEEVVIEQDTAHIDFTKSAATGEINILTGKPEPKRRRRTKAEIEAAAAAAPGTTVETTVPVEPEVPTDPAPTPPVEPQDTPPSETASTEPASESPSSVPTPAELNTKAAAVAKKIGPEKIRDHIRELGGTLISTLSPDALVAFNDWLDQQ